MNGSAIRRRWRHDHHAEPRHPRRLRREVRLPRQGQLRLQEPQGTRRRDRGADLRAQGEPRWMRDYRLKALEIFEKKPMPNWGATSDRSTSRTSTTYVKPAANESKTWEDVPAEMKRTFDKLGIPEAEQKVPVGRGRAVRLGSRLPQDQGEPREAGRDLPLLRPRPQGARGAVQAVLRHRGALDRQQVRGAELRGVVGRVVHLRAQGRPRRGAAPGLLPDQHQGHGPVRAHADHRRRGRVRALRRGVHRADLRQRLAAFGGGRDHRQGGGALPLHHHPELVEQRLQPGHQAGGGLPRRDHGVGRRESRLQAGR